MLNITLFKKILLVIMVSVLTSSCGPREERVFTGAPGEVELITVAPGHFHAYLVQKDMYDQVNPTVHVYAPESPEVVQHLAMIENYNTRAENPTSWDQVVYTGSDYLERMLRERPGNVVVLAGNNQLKTNYIMNSVDAGLNVLSDKPMAINKKNFNLLVEAFETAGKNNVLLYDIMTERYEITSILQKEIMRLPGVFGLLEKGSPQNPAVIKESVHHFFKYVSGQVLRRPPWFFDVNQQGDGIVDVTTHLVDLIQWSCFHGVIIDYENDVEMLSASRWPTGLEAEQFERVTGVEAFPDYLEEYIDSDGILQVYANGEMDYVLNGVHARVIVKWDYSAPEGAGDTHYSLTRGTNASLIIKQGEEQDYKPVLYIRPAGHIEMDDFEEILAEEFTAVQEKYPGIELERIDDSWKVNVPDVYDVGHEAHFASVTRKYLRFLVDGRMPEWEVPNMIAKYYITTSALEMARQSD